MDDRQLRWKEILSLDKSGAVSLLRLRLESFVTHYPRELKGWAWLAETLRDVADYSGALRCVREFAKRCPPKLRYYPPQLMGELYRYRGDYAAAMKWFRKSLELNPRNDSCWIFLGAVLARRGNIRDAKAAHRKAIKLNGVSADEAYLNLGLIYRAEKQYKLGLKATNAALKIDPQYRAANKLRLDLEKVLEDKSNKPIERTPPRCALRRRSSAR